MSIGIISAVFYFSGQCVILYKARTLGQAIINNMNTYKKEDFLAYPILYTFRCCPYAIRARMAIVYSKINV